MQGLEALCREFSQLKGPLLEERAQYTVAVMRSLATRCALHDFYEFLRIFLN